MMSRMAASFIEHTIAPRATDPNIDYVPAVNPQFNHHYVLLDPSARGNTKLLVFMPGAGNRPTQWQRLDTTAARLGYHVIGLMYQNDVAIVQVCTGSAKPSDCSENVRLEVLDGIDRSTLVNVTPANSIDHRLATLLRYLADSFPNEGWSRFLEDTAPKWSQIAVAGQSQGAGEAALIAKLRHVDRVVMFSGPPDARVPDEVDRWVAIGETPVSKYFALLHHRDHLGAGIRANLAALGLRRFGDSVVAELSEPPYGGTHILVTDLEPQGARPTDGSIDMRPHQSTARDDRTPLGGPDGQTPLLLDAWRYLLGEPPHGGAEPVLARETP